MVMVGAGLSGLVFAERAYREFGMTSLVIEKRDHIGGNCYDYVNEKGIRVSGIVAFNLCQLTLLPSSLQISKYGIHAFHTNNERVWEYVQQFTRWTDYQLKPKANVSDIDGVYQIVPNPPNMDTVNILFKENITTVKEMEAWLDERKPKYDHEPRNGEEMSLTRVGKDLYEKIFKEYTKKQWDKYPKELAPSVLARLPVRLDHDDRYFNDKYQALPSDGYTEIFENLTRSCNGAIHVRLNVDYFDVKDKLPKHKYLIFTGPIDAYFASMGMDKLEYRSLIFKTEHLKPPGGYFQPNVMVNHPGKNVNFTRAIEYKHLPTAGAREELNANPWTTVVREFSTANGDPYYPIPNDRNQNLYKKYQKLAEKEEGVLFLGRLASYKYFNMDQAILNVLEEFDRQRPFLKKLKARH